MEPIYKTYTHNDFGTLRTVHDGRQFFFCARDIGQMLGYKNGEKTIRRRCPTMMQFAFPTDTGTESLCFMTPVDVDDFLDTSTKKDAEVLSDWLCDVVIPAMAQDVGQIDTDDLCLIHEADLHDYVYNMLVGAHLTVNLLALLDKLPTTPQNRPIKTAAQDVQSRLYEMLSIYGLKPETLDTLDEADIEALYDDDIISPEDAGYIRRDQARTEVAKEVSEVVARWCKNCGE